MCPAVTPSDPVALTCELVAIPSVTPADEGCQKILTDRLTALGFEIHDLSSNGITNFFARRGSAGPHFCFAGHTDVVPTGPVDQWHSDPFVAVERDGHLYGRGTADMKGALAAMICATESFLQQTPHPNGSLSFLITGDEEADARYGTRHMVEWLQQQDQLPDYCLIGEPSSDQRLADTIKHGRRGSMNGVLTIIGVQGHVAFPDQAENPIHRALAALDRLARHSFDAGTDDFPATALQITNIHGGTGTTNVIPGTLEVTVNLRFSPALTPEDIDQTVREMLDADGLNYTLDWSLSGLPFLTAPGPLLDGIDAAVEAVTGSAPLHSTGGGTSDGRFIAPAGVPVAELGLRNATIHKIDEHVRTDDIRSLTRIYEALLTRLLG